MSWFIIETYLKVYDWQFSKTKKNILPCECTYYIMTIYLLNVINIVTYVIYPQTFPQYFSPLESKVSLMHQGDLTIVRANVF